jgi:RNA polymerase sigma-70 factor (ECF subfamily)
VTSEIYTLEGIDGEHEALDVILRRAQGGEEAAFEEILERFEGKALALARHLGASASDAEDIAQEAFLRLFRHIDTYRGGRTFTAWFYRIVLNTARTHLRGSAATRLTVTGTEDDVSRPDAFSSPGRHGAHEPSPDEPLLEAERRAQVRRALLLLSEREREVIILRDIQGLGTWAVARILNLNPITVRRHAMQARARLRVLLGG